MMVLIIHTGIVWVLRKAEDGWLNIGLKGDKKGQPIPGFLQGHLVEYGWTRMERTSISNKC